MGTAVRSSGGGRKRNLPSNLKSKLTRITPPDELMSDIAIRIWKTQSKILIERGVLISKTRRYSWRTAMRFT
jgi:hypothetical protein